MSTWGPGWGGMWWTSPWVNVLVRVYTNPRTLGGVEPWHRVDGSGEVPRTDETMGPRTPRWGTCG